MQTHVCVSSVSRPCSSRNTPGRLPVGRRLWHGTRRVVCQPRSDHERCIKRVYQSGLIRHNVGVHVFGDKLFAGKQSARSQLEIVDIETQPGRRGEF